MRKTFAAVGVGLAFLVPVGSAMAMGAGKVQHALKRSYGWTDPKCRRVDGMWGLFDCVDRDPVSYRVARVQVTFLNPVVLFVDYQEFSK